MFRQAIPCCSSWPFQAKKVFPVSSRTENDNCICLKVCCIRDWCQVSPPVLLEVPVYQHVQTLTLISKPRDFAGKTSRATRWSHAFISACTPPTCSWRRCSALARRAAPTRTTARPTCRKRHRSKTTIWLRRLHLHPPELRIYDANIQWWVVHQGKVDVVCFVLVMSQSYTPHAFEWHSCSCAHWHPSCKWSCGKFMHLINENLWYQVPTFQPREFNSHVIFTPVCPSPCAVISIFCVSHAFRTKTKLLGDLFMTSVFERSVKW